ncbi:hypothetical protein BpHYR1_039640 [Brachionus plicatilis]|uniref:Uncharacterized protein n=1 Tax=Brachionus plicatilis TaxID=10195 RepID=A0A3M7S8C6_BRAPC|nr:hypothetical protein BpHYR1_039640 [Brachionus plicatilis]
MGDSFNAFEKPQYQDFDSSNFKNNLTGFKNRMTNQRIADEKFITKLIRRRFRVPFLFINVKISKISVQKKPSTTKSDVHYAANKFKQIVGQIKNVVPAWIVQLGALFFICIIKFTKFPR